MKLAPHTRPCARPTGPTEPAGPHATGRAGRLGGVRAVRTALAAGLVALSVAGCQASVQTTLTVTGPQQADVRVAATFSGEAAEAIRANEAMRQQLVGVFTDRAGATPEIHDEDGRLEFVSTLSYDRLAAASGVTGVRAASLSGEDARTTLTLDLGPADVLSAAVRTGTAKQPDSDALATTMLASTTLAVSVTFPGGVESHTGASPAPASKDGVVPPASQLPAGIWSADPRGDTVTFLGRVDSAKNRVVVVGDPRPSRTAWYAGAGAALLAAAALGAQRRRRGGARPNS